MLHSPIATELWSMVFSMFGIQWVMPEFWICSLLGEVFWASLKHYMGSGPSLHYVVPKA